MNCHLIIACLVVSAGAASAAEKPAAVQVCVQLADGLALFAPRAQPFMRSLGSDTWMLDFDLALNGHAPERITRSSPDCFRAWLPAEKLKRITLDFSKLPLNLVTAERTVELQLKPDLWSDGGKVVVSRAPWSTASSTTTGELVFERQSPNGPVAMRDWKQLPSGTYVLKYTPAPQPKATCPITLNVVGSGTVRADRNEALFRELVEYYRVELLPAVIAKHKLQCEPAEAAQVTVKLVDGAFRNPLEPTIGRVRLEEKEPRYQLSIDGQAAPFTNDMQVTLSTGQAVVFSLLDSPAVR